eukprot:m.140558 g.140558  ORF g.140558 m.140558 type:complete len:107 (+) comp10015_c0_seq2:3-323(+)
MRARRSKRQSSRDATTRMQLLRSAPIISGVFKSSSPSATASTRRRAQISISCHRCPRLKPFVGPAALRAHVERVHSVGCRWEAQSDRFKQWSHWTGQPRPNQRAST